MAFRNSIRQLFALAVALLLLVAVGHFLPLLLWEKPPQISPPATVIAAEKENPQTDLLPDSLLSSLGGAIDRRKRGVLPPGPPFPLYAYQAAKQIDLLGCRVERFEEIAASQLRLRYRCPSFEPHQIDLIKGGRYKAGSAQLTLIFETAGMEIATLSGLHDLQIPFSILLDPFVADSTLEQDLERLQPDATLLLLHHREMARRTSRSHNSAIQPQQTPEQVAARLEELYQRFPTAWGVVLSGKSNSFNYRHVVEALHSTLSRRSATLLLSAPQTTPLLDSLCGAESKSCLKIERITESEQLSRAIRRAGEEARRRGSKILVLPLHKESLEAVQLLKEEAEQSGLEFLPLPKQAS